MRLNRGFTLFEVAISLLIITVAVLLVIALLPAGAKAQQMARFQMYAAMKANSLNNAFAQHDINRLNAGIFKIGDDDTERLGQKLIDESSGLFANGKFDFERVALSGKGNYPVPTEIARRLDSQNDEIGKVLDRGGNLYYSSPVPIPGFEVERSANSADLAAVPELQRLVYAVVDYPQQNLLPYHPVQVPQWQTYPFPPMIVSDYTPWKYSSSLPLWHRLRAGRTVGSVNKDDYEYIELPGYDALDLTRTKGAGDADHYGPRPKQQRTPQGNNWEWYAYLDEMESRPENGTGSAWSEAANTFSPWLAGLPEFRRLGRDHFLRLAAHFSSVSTGSAQVVQTDIPWNLPFGQVDTNADGTPDTWMDASAPQRIVNAVPGSTRDERGYPAPATGLPIDPDRRGTDILYEDHETARSLLKTQLRLGMPSLERRVMYRTAALMLWPRVYAGVAANAARPDIASGRIPNAGGASALNNDPNVIPSGGWPAGVPNPLLEEVPLPANPRDIHPAQVLALSYIAHAAMVTAGYKPPFIDDKGTLSPVGGRGFLNNSFATPPDPNHKTYDWSKPAVPPDSNLVPDETLPLRDLTADEYYLWKPIQPTTTSTGTGKGWIPDQILAPPLTTSTTFDPNTMVSKLNPDGTRTPFTYRRMTGPILNPIPPPYADRGAFNWRGQAFNRPTPQPSGGNYRITWTSANYAQPSGSGFTNSDPSDTMMARQAHENCMRWAIAFNAENPYDFRVPKPLNAPTLAHKPLFAWDLFNQSGSANRGNTPNQATRTPRFANNQFYTITWSSKRTRFSTAYGYPDYFDGFGRITDSRWGTNGSTNISREGVNSPASGMQDPNRIPADMCLYLPYQPFDHTTNSETGEFLTNWRFWRVPNSREARITGIRRFFTDSSQSPVEVLLRQNVLHGYLDTGAEDGLPPMATSPAVNLNMSNAADRARLRLNCTQAARPSRAWWPQAFAPQERMRQLVFWAVDWKSYEDAESAASAPSDRSMFARNFSYDPTKADSAQDSGLGSPNYGQSETLIPEGDFAWANPARDKTRIRFRSGGNLVDGGASSWEDARFNIMYTNSTNNYSGIMRPVWLSLGMYGADRNFNGTFDRGPVPKSVRMQAVEVSRFVIYDPIGWTGTGP